MNKNTANIDLTCLTLLEVCNNDPRELAQYVSEHPENYTDEIAQILMCYSCPLLFANVETKYFRNPRFVDACKIAITSRVKQDLNSKKLTDDLIIQAEDILDMYKEKCEFEKMNIAKEDRANFTDLLKAKDLLKEFKEIDFEKIMSDVLDNTQSEHICDTLQAFTDDFFMFEQYVDTRGKNTKKIQTVIDVYNNPNIFHLADIKNEGKYFIPTEFFKDADFLKACQIATTASIEESIQHEEKTGLKATGWIERITENFKQRCFEERYNIKKEERKNSKATSEQKVLKVLNEFSKM